MEPARRIVMFNWMTANGYFSGADGNLDWVVPDEEQAKAAMAGIPLFDTMLFGRRTYESLRNSGAAPTTALPLRRTRTVAENERRNTSPSQMVKRIEQSGFVQEPQARDVEKFPHRLRTRSARDREHETPVRERYDNLR